MYQSSTDFDLSKVQKLLEQLRSKDQCEFYTQDDYDNIGDKYTKSDMKELSISLEKELK